MQRQVIHRTSDIGTPKAESAKRFVNDLDPNISVESKVIRIDENNAKSLFDGHDLIIDGTDITSAKTAATDATVAAEHLGFMSLTPGKTDITMRLLINIGTQTGTGTNELLSQEIGINE